MHAVYDGSCSAPVCWRHTAALCLGTKKYYEKKPEPTEEMPTEEDSGPEAQRALQVAQLADVSLLKYMQDMQEAGSETNPVANADAETPEEEEDATE